VTSTDSFLWGAASAPHQIEGNNVNSDFWAQEGLVPGMQRSGDAVDSYHRFEEDMRLLADAGLNSYRFGIEWARIEPVPGLISRAELAHYRRMIDTARDLGLTPVVTVQHFTTPRWFAEQGSWLGDGALDRWAGYVTAAAEILQDVPWVVTINEPNMLTMMLTMRRRMAEQPQEWQSPTVDTETDTSVDTRASLPAPDPEVGRVLVEAHHRAREILHERTDAAVGWTVANRAFAARPGAEAVLADLQHVWEDLYLEGARGDDFVGVQAYSSQWVGLDGIEPHPPHPDNTLVGSAYRPDSLGMAIRHTWDVLDGSVPIVVTENGIATADDTRRIAYTDEALRHLFAAVDDGVDVRGYLHWSALDNYEWGHWEPTFGLVSADRETFVRTPKPSLAWLGDVARRGRP
jgi:beta-glucosidase